MYRIYFLILLVFAAPVFQGCGILGFFKGDSSARDKEIEATQKQVPKEVMRLTTENTSLKKEIDTLKKNNEKVRNNNLREIAKVEDERKVLDDELKKLREENQKISRENKLLEERLKKIQQKEDLRGLKIKVLSGDWNVTSVNRMAKRLMDLDYKIGRIGFAPRSNFKRNTVYFAPKFEKEGSNLVSSLGANTVLKPLTWSSIFDLIIVTGKNVSSQ